MFNKNYLLNKVAGVIMTEKCCNECLLKKIKKIVSGDVTQDDNIRQVMLSIICDMKKTDEAKIDEIIDLIDRYN